VIVAGAVIANGSGQYEANMRGQRKNSNQYKVGRRLIVGAGTEYFVTQKAHKKQKSAK
jgi:hypothetical protein